MTHSTHYRFQMEVKLGFKASDLVAEGVLTVEILQIVKEWLSVEGLPQLTDEQIALFLVSNCHDLPSTQSTIKNYFQIRNSTPEIFSNRKLANLEKMLNVGCYCALPKRTSDNCAVIVVKLQDSDASNFNFKDHLKLICMLLDSVTFDGPPDGLISILDMEGSSLTHLASIKLQLVSAFTRYAQDAMPLKMKSVHLFNGGIVLQGLFKMFKPFLNARVRDMIHFHNVDDNMEKWLSKDCLPKEYGGELSAVRVHYDETIEKLRSMQDYFDAEQAQRESSR